MNLCNFEIKYQIFARKQSYYAWFELPIIMSFFIEYLVLIH